MNHVRKSTHKIAVIPADCIRLQRKRVPMSNISLFNHNSNGARRGRKTAFRLGALSLGMAVVIVLLLALSQVPAAQAGAGDATGLPINNSTVMASETLSVDTSGISDPDGLVNATFSYQWVSSDGTTDADIANETSSTYIIKPWDLGNYIKVRVSFNDDAGNEETLTSAATAAVEASPNHLPTGVLRLGGMAEVGQALSVFGLGIWGRDIRDANGLRYATFNYHWFRNDGSTDVDIPDANGSSYTLTDSDQGKTIKVRVSFTDDGGNEESLTSAATGAVAPRPPLTASFESKPSNHDGQTAFTFELRFSEEFGIGYQTLRDHAFTVTGGTVEKAQRLEKQSNIGWRITVEPDSNAAVTVVLPITENCGDQGAVCTEDGRMLSNRLELSVGGPSQ